MEISEHRGRVEVALNEASSLASPDGLEGVQNRPTGQATFEGEDATADLPDLENFGKSEGRTGPAQLVHQPLSCPDVLGPSSGVQDPQHPVVAEGENPGFATPAQRLVVG